MKKILVIGLGLMVFGLSAKSFPINVVIVNESPAIQKDQFSFVKDAYIINDHFAAETEKSIDLKSTFVVKSELPLYQNIFAEADKATGYHPVIYENSIGTLYPNKPISTTLDNAIHYKMLQNKNVLFKFLYFLVR